MDSTSTKRKHQLRAKPGRAAGEDFPVDKRPERLVWRAPEENSRHVLDRLRSSRTTPLTLIGQNRLPRALVVRRPYHLHTQQRGANVTGPQRGLLLSPRRKGINRNNSNHSRLSDQAITTLGKTMATDDKKTSSAPKNGAAEKKRVAAKKDEAQPKDKTTPDADRSKAESGEKLPAYPQVIVGARAKNRLRKHIGITGTLFSRTRKSGKDQRAGIAAQSRLTRNCESVAAKLSLFVAWKKPTGSI